MACLHPVLIVNPKFVSDYSVVSRWTLPEGEVTPCPSSSSWPTFKIRGQVAPYYHAVSQYNYKDYRFWIGDKDYPLYFAVPCRKCTLCRQRKKEEWSVRAVSEMHGCKDVPVFVTLTFKQKFLGNNRLEKKPLQDFLKRLRTWLSNHGYSSFRYVGCGEYGRKTLRKHYHLILYDFMPGKNIYFKLHAIRNMWKVPMLDASGNMVYRKDGAPIRETIGFVKVLPANTGSIGYIMKYMCKECRKPALSWPPAFFCSSRRPGIGLSHMSKYIEYYRSNPTMSKFQVCDPMSGRLFKSTLPSYFKTLCFPSHSQLLPQDYIAKLRIYWNIRMAAFAVGAELMDRTGDPYVHVMIPDKHAEFLKRIDFLGYSLVPVINDKSFSYLKSWPDEDLQDAFLYYVRFCHDLIEKLMSYDIDYEYIKRIDEIKSRRADFFQDLPEDTRDLYSLARYYEYLYTRSNLNDTF